MSYFEQLGVSPSATLKEINHAFRLKSREVHPDRQDGSHEAFLRLTEAYKNAYEACSQKDDQSKSVFEEQLEKVSEFLKYHGFTSKNEINTLIANTYFSRPLIGRSWF
jgi:DnaJ-class molecular chaperone